MEFFIKLSTDFESSFLGIGPDVETKNWWKVFKACPITIKFH